jgi:hypothetical protein
MALLRDDATAFNGPLSLLPADHSSIRWMTAVRAILLAKNCFHEPPLFDVVRP